MKRIAGASLALVATIALAAPPEVYVRGACSSTRRALHCVATTPDETGDGVPELVLTEVRLRRSGRVDCRRSFAMVVDGDERYPLRTEGVCACRPARGICDVSEYPVDGACPVDAKRVGECAPGRWCDGVRNSCPR